MLFSSSVFLFFFLPAVILIYNVFVKTRHSKNMFLLLASLAFYAWGEPWFVFVMMLSIMGNWFFGLLVDKHREEKTKARLIIIAMLIMNFSIMFVFKYLIFTVQNVNHLLFMAIPVPNIVLPIGISFFTFQAVSYVLDVYRKDGVVQKNPLTIALFISLFPQLIAGPIVRYKVIAGQLFDRKENADDFSEGVKRFIRGLAKKVLIANNMAILADKAFNMQTDELTVLFAWLGILGYSFQIFFDFSGYSDMAIGLGKMFGFHFLENFNYPYISKSISEFWRRWHISLSTWFRDYVYFPMGGSRVNSKWRLVFNLFIVWLLTGLWHGANWTFVTWGILYFLLISFEKLIDFEHRFQRFGFFKRVYVLMAVIICWVFFRSEGLAQAFSYLSIMFGAAGNRFLDSHAALYFMENMYFFIFAILFSTPVAKNVSEKIKNKKVMKYLSPIGYLVLFVITLSYITKGSYNPFIYFNF